MSKSKKNPYIGPSFQSFLDKEGIADEVNEAAVNERPAPQLDQARKSKGLSKAEKARRMRTSRSVLAPLDGKDSSVTLNTLQKTAKVVGKRLRLELVDGQRRAPRIVTAALDAPRNAVTGSYAGQDHYRHQRRRHDRVVDEITSTRGANRVGVRPKLSSVTRHRASPRVCPTWA